MMLHRVPINTPLSISNFKHTLDTIYGDPEYSWDAYIHA